MGKDFLIALLVIHIGSALVILLGGGFLLLRKKPIGFWRCFLVGWLWQVLLSLPAGIWQALKGWPHISVSGIALWGRLLTPLIGWPFNAGGFTVRTFFEATVCRWNGWSGNGHWLS